MEQLSRCGFNSRRLHSKKTLNCLITIFYRKTHHYNKTKDRGPRLNHQIRISPIRLIDEKGQNLGVVETGKALQIAQEKGLDLIEIVPHLRPPICRIMDHGKYQYQQSIKKKRQKNKQKKVEVKGIRISLRISQHDLETKVKQAEKFLKHGDKVRIEVRLRGREKAHFDLAKEKLNQFIQLISLETKIEQEAKKQPNGFNMVIAKE